MNKALLTRHHLLQPYVKDIRTFESQTLTSVVQRFNVFADGSPGIMFYQSEADMLLDNKPLPTLFLYGQTVKSIELTVAGDFRIILILLHSHVVKALFGIEASELTDCCMDLDMLPYTGIKQAKEQLLEAHGSLDLQVSLLMTFLEGLADKTNIQVDAGLWYATQNLRTSGGMMSLKILRHKLQVSERTFERLFMKHVGISPRMFARICRFNAAVHQLKTGNFVKLTDVAYDSGFTDQAHFIRTFKEFTGITPKKYVKKNQPMMSVL